jgi:tetratricopeptide (TPR) repeat protein
VIRPVACALAALLAVPSFQTSPASPIRGLTAVAEVGRAYDTILDGDFALAPGRINAACAAASREACLMLEALSQWWQIALEPESRFRDVTFERTVGEAIDAAAEWTVREPQRAEAWFYLGAAYGTRVQWRVLREERLAAARDGKRIKEALERALALDPEMHDAAFGLGLYRYYADIAPAALKFLRWLLLLPAGDRKGGLRQIDDARERGALVRGEADYQLHLIYLWYEHRPKDALAIVRDLQRRYPGNALFWLIEAEIEDVYFHDHAASLAAAAHLLALAESGRVHDAPLAVVRARLQMATELDHLGERRRAIDTLSSIIAARPARPYGAVVRAQSLQKIIAARKAPQP